MSKKSYIVSAIFLLIFYLVGLPLCLIGYFAEETNVLFVVIGLLLCGLLTGIFSLTLARVLFPLRSSGGGALTKRLAFFIIGLLLGIVVTPIMIIVLFCKAAKEKKAAVAPAAESAEPAPATETVFEDSATETATAAEPAQE